YRRVETTVGRIIFTDTINRALRAAEVDVQVDLPTKEMGKGELKGLVGWLIRRFGNRIAAQVLDEIKRLGFHFATVSGITIAVTDIKIPEAKDEILTQADLEVARIEKDFRRGLITDEERYNEVIEVWTKAKDTITTAVGEALDRYG